MFTVIEHWYLKDQAAQDALKSMQDMDDLVEDNAHGAPGWSGHARFFQLEHDPNHIIMIYSWNSKEEAQRMLHSESGLISGFVKEHCSREREIEFATELPVDV